MAADGTCAICLAHDQIEGTRDRVLAEAKLPDWRADQWHNVLLRFEGADISFIVDRETVLRTHDTTFVQGMAGLITAGDHDTRTSACFDNLTVNTVRGAPVKPAGLDTTYKPIYATGR